jgi:ABC-type phosphonate transport system ATPase subunit
VRRVFVAAGEFPFVWGQPPRRRRYGLKAQRYDDIPTLLRDEVTMERLVGLVDEPVDDREVRVPQRALDAMHDRVRRLEWGVTVLRDIRDQQNDHVAVLVERLKGEAAA